MKKSFGRRVVGGQWSDTMTDLGKSVLNNEPSVPAAPSVDRLVADWAINRARECAKAALRNFTHVSASDLSDFELAVGGSFQALRREYGTDWKPRSTAPDDEIEIIGYQPEIGDANADEMPSHYGITTGKWLRSGVWGACTHWMPLPAPPQPERVSDRTTPNTDEHKSPSDTAGE